MAEVPRAQCESVDAEIDETLRVTGTGVGSMTDVTVPEGVIALAFGFTMALAVEVGDAPAEPQAPPGLEGLGTEAEPFVHYLDLVDAGWSGSFGVEAYIPRLGFYFDPADYVAVSSSYLPEVNVSNPTGLDQTATLVRQGVGAVATITIPAGTVKKRIEGLVPITWASGLNKYAWMASSTSVSIFTGRVRCEHVGLTKAKLYMSPVLNGNEGATQGVVEQILLFSGPALFVQLVGGMWKRTDVEFDADTVSWGFESVMGKSGFSPHLEWGIYNVTQAAIVAASKTDTYPGPTADVYAVNWSTDPNWANGDTYRMYLIERSVGLETLGTGKAFGGRMYVYLTGIHAVTTRVRLSKDTGTVTPLLQTTSRVLAQIEDAGEIKIEASARMLNGGATGSIKAYDAGAADDGTAGVAVDASEIIVTDVHTVHVSAAWASAHGTRYCELDAPVTGGATLRVDWVLFRVSYESIVIPPGAVCLCVDASIDNDTLRITGTGEGTIEEEEAQLPLAA